MTVLAMLHLCGRKLSVALDSYCALQCGHVPAWRSFTRPAGVKCGSAAGTAWLTSHLLVTHHRQQHPHTLCNMPCCCLCLFLLLVT